MKKYIDSFMNYRFLLSELIKKGIRLKYRRSYLGILWSLLEPLLTMIVLTIVFGTLLQKSDDRTFPIYILCGRLLYSFYSSSTKASLTSIHNNASMIKKVYVPKYLYTLSSILYNFIIFLISLIVLVAVGAVLGVRPSIYMLQAPVALLLLLALSIGSGLILATLGVFFRDLEYLWSVALMLIMYTCAIFYEADRLYEGGYGWLLNVNPIYGVIRNFRGCIAGTGFHMPSMIYCLSFGVISILLGTYLFYKKQDEFILNL